MLPSKPASSLRLLPSSLSLAHTLMAPVLANAQRIGQTIVDQSHRRQGTSPFAPSSCPRKQSTTKSMHPTPPCSAAPRPHLRRHQEAVEHRRQPSPVRNLIAGRRNPSPR
jgi:hypothetical protein